MSKLVCVLASVLFASLLILPATAAAGEEEDAKREKWVGEYQELRQRHAQLGAELAQARKDYSRGRSSKHLRGEGKAGLIKELQSLEGKFTAADQELKDFPDKARRDGAFPGWFRDLDAPQPGPAQPAAAAAAADRDQDGPSRTGSRADQRAAERNRRRPGRD